MPKIPCRKFNLADIMILIAFTAVGLALGRPVLGANNRVQWWFAYPLSYGSTLLGCWTIAHLVLRLNSPRQSIRRTFRQPGAAASLVGSLSIFLWIMLFGFAAIFRGWARVWNLCGALPLTVGPAVIGAWVLLGVTRTARSEKGWVDRIGIALGIAWVLLMLDVQCELIF